MKKTRKKAAKKAVKKAVRKSAKKTSNVHTDKKSHNTSITVISGLRSAINAAKSQYGKLAEKFAVSTTKREKSAIRKQMAAVMSKIHKINKV